MSPPVRKLTILAAPGNGVGNVNSCSGALSGAIARGHRVIFVVERAFSGKLAPLGIEECLYVKPGTGSGSGTESSDQNSSPQPPPANAGAAMAKALLAAKIIGDFEPLYKMRNMVQLLHGDQVYAEIEQVNQTLKEAIQEYKPDLMYYSGGFVLPAMHYSGIPWVFSVSTNPLGFLRDEDTPPGGAGK